MPPPLFSFALVFWTWYGQGWNAEAVIFTCTSNAIKYKPSGFTWVRKPSHLGLASQKHLASSCHKSIQVHFGLTQAPPLLVEVIPDYRATVVKWWYDVFFLFFFSPSLCLYSCSSTAGHLTGLLLYGLLCAKLTSHFSLIYMYRFGCDGDLLWYKQGYLISVYPSKGWLHSFLFLRLPAKPQLCMIWLTLPK